MAFDLKIGKIRKLNQREIVLVTLVGIIGIVALFSYLRGEGGIGFTNLQSRFSSEEARVAPGSRLRVPEINLALLEEPTDAFENKRNLFAYGRSQRTRSTAPPPRTGNQGNPPGMVPGGNKTPEEKQAEEEAAEKAAEEAAATRLPDPPELNLKFVGFIGPPTDKTVFLTDEEAEKNYIGGVGESIAGQFRILEVGYEFVEIGYTDPLFEGQSERIILAEWSEEEDESAD